jgi:hypothetical protein
MQRHEIFHSCRSMTGFVKKDNLFEYFLKFFGEVIQKVLNNSPWYYNQCLLSEQNLKFILRNDCQGYSERVENISFHEG